MSESEIRSVTTLVNMETRYQRLVEQYTPLIYIQLYKSRHDYNHDTDKVARAALRQASQLALTVMNNDRHAGPDRGA